jgi:DNA-binding NarL/FixJ family response regulator
MDSNVLLGGGRKILREGLALLLEKQKGLKLVGEAEDVCSVPKLVRALPVDLAILIESSVGPISAEQVSQILRAASDLHVIILGLNPEARWLRGVLDAGVTSCLSRNCSGQELLTAIRAALQGDIYLSPELLGKLVTSHRPSSLRNLAPREREILRRIAEGQITKRIAADLGIGVKTVETHRRRIMEKLNAFSVADLTKHAIRQGLTTLEVES